MAACATSIKATFIQRHYAGRATLPGSHMPGCAEVQQGCQTISLPRGMAATGTATSRHLPHQQLRYKCLRLTWLPSLSSTAGDTLTHPLSQAAAATCMHLVHQLMHGEGLTGLSAMSARPHSPHPGLQLPETPLAP